MNAMTQPKTTDEAALPAGVTPDPWLNVKQIALWRSLTADQVRALRKVPLCPIRNVPGLGVGAFLDELKGYFATDQHAPVQPGTKGQRK
ncbi:hypothetical protein [Maricaulis maris]|uniref:hypothetical protein n=1 Tax=Maricaulis maris TaxID=74318 RepID=UPI003B8AA274